MSDKPPARPRGPGVSGRLWRFWHEITEPFVGLFPRGPGQGQNSLVLILWHYPKHALYLLFVGLPVTLWRFFRYSSWPVKLAMFSALVLAGGAAGYVIVKEMRARQRGKASAAWGKYGVAVNRFDLKGAKEALEEAKELAIDQEQRDSAQRFLDALEAGDSGADDQTSASLLVMDHYRHGRLAEAAREARKRLTSDPHDWMSRCVLAQESLRAGKPADAAAQLSELPKPEDAKPGLTAFTLLMALQLHREAGKPSAALTKFTIANALPMLRQTNSADFPPLLKLQLLELYQHALSDLGNSKELTNYLIPAIATGGQVLAAPEVPPSLIAALGSVSEMQLGSVREFRKRNLLEQAEADSLTTDLEARVKQCWEKAIAGDPARPLPYVGLATWSLRHGDPVGAVKALEDGLKACGDRTELLAAQTRLLAQIDPASSLAKLELSARQRPDELPLWQLMAEAASNSGRRDKAIEACQQARRIKPDLPWAAKMEARLRLDQGRPNDTLEALAMYRDQPFADAEVVELRCRALIASGSVPALDKFLVELKSAERQPPILIGAAVALLSTGRFAQANELVELGLKQADRHIGLWRLKADALRLLSEPKEAGTWDRDRAQSAVLAYERLLFLEPSDLSASGNIAWLTLKAFGDADAALRRAAPLVKAEAEGRLPAGYFDTLGAIYLRLGKYEEARGFLERSSKLQPIVSGWLSLARCYHHLHRPIDAQRYLELARNRPRSAAETAELTEMTRITKGTP